MKVVKSILVGMWDLKLALELEIWTWNLDAHGFLWKSVVIAWHIVVFLVHPITFKGKLVFTVRVLLSPLVAHLTQIVLDILDFIQRPTWPRKWLTEALLSYLSHRIDCRVKDLPIEVYLSLGCSIRATLRLINPSKAIPGLLNLLTISPLSNWYLNGNVLYDSKHLILAHIINVLTLVTLW